MTRKTDLAKAMAEAISKTKIFGELTPEEAELEAKIQEVLDSPEFKERYERLRYEREEMEVRASLDHLSRLPQYAGMSQQQLIDEMQKVGEEGILILPTSK